MTNKKTEENFLSRKNLHRTLWSIILWILAFAGGILLKSITGPERLMLVNTDGKKDTIINIIQYQPHPDIINNDTQKENKERKQESIEQPNTKNNTIHENRRDTISPEIIIENNSDSSINFNNVEHTPIETKAPSIIKSQKKQLFFLPKNIEGFIEKKSNSYTKITINKNEFSQNDMITISVNFFDQNTLSLITPIFVEVKESISENSFDLIWSDQYKITSTNQIINFNADFKPGKYILSVGFVMLDELNKKYPTRFQRRLGFVVR